MVVIMKIMALLYSLLAMYAVVILFKPVDSVYAIKGLPDKYAKS